MSGQAKTWFSGSSSGIAIGTLLLVLLCYVVVPQSVSPSALRGMVPFASILILVAVGQTLVIQQGGIDLSVPGMMSLAGVMTAMSWAGSTMPLAALIVLIVLTGAISGMFAGILVTRLNVAPIVSTLGVNTVLYGINMKLSGGAPASAEQAIIRFANIQFFGISILAFIAIFAAAGIALIVKKTVAGRRFEFVGASAKVARAAGLRVSSYKIAAYALSGMLSAVAGMLLAGIMQSPSAFQGDAYLMASIAAVVLGGTSLLGGSGNFLATAIAALFLTQLRQFVLTTGAPIGVQFLFQGLAILIGVAVYLIDFKTMLKRR